MLRLVVLVIAFSSSAYGYSCKEESIFGITRYKECPGPFDNPEQQYCCGPEENRRCCSTPFEGLDIEVDSDLIQSIITGVVVLIVVCILLTFVCCCCCPFCLLYKRRNRGAVHNPGPTVTQMQVTANHPQPGYAPVQTSSYPSQQPAHQPYPPQQPYPGQQAPYPTQSGSALPYPTQSMPPQAGFGTQPPQNAPYPTQPYQSMPAEQPPPYSEKQPAFNPNY